MSRAPLASALAFLALAAPATAQMCGAPRDLSRAGFVSASAHALSDDGEVVVGSAVTAGGLRLACLWRDSGAPVVIPTPAGFSSSARGVSADGSVVVGVLFAASGEQPFRWTAATGTQVLPTLGGGGGACYAVSSDGSVAVGASEAPGAPTYRASLWSSSGVQDLGTLGGGYSEANDVSSDGSVVVGLALDAAGNTHAFRWTAAGGMQAPVAASYSEAHAVSRDGSTLVGLAVINGSTDAFRWSTTGGTVPLGSGSSLAWGRAVSDDGSVIVGEREDASFTYRPFVWTHATGAQPIATPPGEWGGAFGLSPEGDLAVGYSASRAWIAHLERPSLGLPFCAPAAPNSTGCWGAASARGSSSVGMNALELVASDLPPHAFGLFLMSRTQVNPQTVPGSQGALCLGGAIGRLDAPGQVRGTGIAGRLHVALDLGALPTGTGVAAAQAGETWTFQAWHRDANPLATSNLTAATAVTLQ